MKEIAKIKGAPQCPIGWHNRLMGDIEYCHSHKYKWRQWIHVGHCKRLGCPYADTEHGKWGGKFDTRESRIIG